MKKFILTLSIAIASYTSSFAQWTGTTNIYNTNTGNVGIGSSSPLYKLDVNGNVNANTYFISAATTNDSPLTSNNFYGTGAVWAFRTGTNNSYNLDTYNTGSPIAAMAVLQNGNVGIGTTSPTGKFQVQPGAYDFLTSTYSIDIGLGGAPGGWARAFRVVNNSNSNGLDGGAFGVTGYGTTPTYAYMAIPTSDVTGFNSSKILVLNNSGNVGIGTTIPDEKLSVLGKIHANEVKVDLNVPGPDYVFEPDYKLQDLGKLRAYVDKNHHLPEIPSAKEIEKDGISLGDMNMRLLKKVEEITLYLFEKDRQIDELKHDMDILKKQVLTAK